MKSKVLIFAGTTEGRELAEYLAHSGVDVMARVATDYGKALMKEAEASSDRLGDDGIGKLIDSGYGTVIDATHPYAVRITEKIRDACASKGAEYIRLLRPEGRTSGADVKVFPDIDSAVSYLNGTKGNIFVTTGSKELEKYTKIDGYGDRVFARVLSLPDVAARCAELGFRGRNLFCMQGPYTEEMNHAMLKQVSAKYLVTKDSGHEGGFEEKIAAAGRAGATVVMIGRPPEDGLSYGEVVGLMAERYGIEPPKRKLTIIGKGVSGMTSEASDAVEGADAVFGAKRMIEDIDKPVRISEYNSDKILAHLEKHKEIRNAAVLMSGDVGFYSGARSLLEKTDRKEFDIRLICGVSSPSYLCAKAGVPWEDVRMTSSHGRDGNAVGLAVRYGKVFTLLGGKTGAKDLMAGLIEYGLGEVRIIVGSDLGTDEESILDGRPADLIGRDIPELSCALIINGGPEPRRIGIPDDEFERGDAPMTKQEARAVAVSYLELSEDSVVYDVGAGTGSVTVECAMAALEGRVYAIEKEHAAASLIRANARKFSVPNITVVEGTAPEALAELPPPTHAFIGGSSGNLKSIVSAILEKNPHARICITSVTLETLSETMECAKTDGMEEEITVCVSSSRAVKAGGYHLMKANNPIHITILRGVGR